MPQLYDNYVTFIASPRTIDIITECIDVRSGLFNFDKIDPTPSLLTHLAAPVEIIDNEDFQRVFGDIPDTIDEIKSHISSAPEAVFDNETARTFNAGTHITLSMSDELHYEYGTDNWKTWQKYNWGCIHLGTATQILHCSYHILSLKFTTEEGIPKGIYNTLRESFDDIHIITGAKYQSNTNLVDWNGIDGLFQLYWNTTTHPTITLTRNKETNAIERTHVMAHCHITPQRHILQQMEAEGFFIDENMVTHEFK